MSVYLPLQQQYDVSKGEKVGALVLHQCYQITHHHFGLSPQISAAFSDIVLKSLSEVASKRINVFASLLKIKAALRNSMVIEEAKTHPKKLIGKKYNVCEATVYKVVATPERYQSAVLLTNVRSLTLDNISDLKAAASVEKHFWPSSLVEMSDVLYDACRRQLALPEKQIEQIANTTILALSAYFGGRTFYLPTGEKIEKALRDDLIYRLSLELPIANIGEKFGLSDASIHQIVKKQKQIRSAIQLT
ncbi:Mor transcription activator family protein [Motilimonas sp. 1_MG-2023]|uniref:Mor transcription activator family protein n=1 Tax=Motilimonas sp. 1_MG-2023 TaxID=3062672 RepID=UPI0026E38D0E|nr:Mor transcription activator family protein [Motilimonas sp. 1_MG-2023]MDO6527379.1 Mor transcription activator family protein [Motilimonas sp. 1_MG-2023]